MCRRRTSIVMHVGSLGRSISFLAIVGILSHDPLFAFKLGNLTRVASLVRSRKEGLHPMVFEFRLGGIVRIVHRESVCGYPLGAV